MATVAEAVIGHNRPPAPTPYEAIKAHIDDLMETAQGFLDGEPITTQEQADDIGRLRAEALAARQAADAQRKIEAKPFDDGKAAVQALWTPLSDKDKGKCVLIEKLAKQALAPFLAAQQKKLDDEAAAQREKARIADEKARDALQKAAATDLAARQAAEDLIEEAAKANRIAESASKQRARAAGGSRRTALRTYHVAQITDRKALLQHYMVNQPEALTEWLQEQAQRDVTAGKRNLPGVTVIDEQRAA